MPVTITNVHFKFISSYFPFNDGYLLTGYKPNSRHPKKEEGLWRYEDHMVPGIVRKLGIRLKTEKKFSKNETSSGERGISAKLIKNMLSYLKCVSNHEVAGSIPGTSTNFKCRLGLERGPPSLVRTIG